MDGDGSGAAGGRTKRGPMTRPMPADWSLGATIPAKDLDGTRRFYQDVLGARGCRRAREASATGPVIPPSVSTRRGIRGAWCKDPEGDILSVVQLPAT
jgi:hypothetical protein